MKQIFVFTITAAPKSWLHQTCIYIGLMVIVKLITTLFIQLDIWDNVKDFVLSPFSNPKIERAITILVIPFFVNVSTRMLLGIVCVEIQTLHYFRTLGSPLIGFFFLLFYNRKG